MEDGSVEVETTTEVGMAWYVLNNSNSIGYVGAEEKFHSTVNDEWKFRRCTEHRFFLMALLMLFISQILLR